MTEPDNDAASALSRQTGSATNWTRDIVPAQQPGEDLHRLVVASLGRLSQQIDYKWRGALGNSVEDVIQSFAVKMLEGKVVSKADRRRGRFRTFLLTCFDHHVIDWLRRPKQDAVPLTCEEDAREMVVEPTGFDAIWAEELFRLICEQLHRRCLESSAPDIWAVATDQILDPVMRSTAPMTYEQLAARHGLGSPNVVAGKVRTARKWFDQCAREMIRGFAVGEDDIEVELREFVQALRGLRDPYAVQPGVAYLYCRLDAELEEYSRDEWYGVADLAPMSAPPIATFDDLFHHPVPPPELLRLVKQYAKWQLDQRVGDLPDEVASIIYYACITVARRHGIASLSTLTNDEVRSGLGWCLRRSWLDDRLRRLFGEAHAELQ